MYCATCGRLLGSNDLICPSCGSPKPTQEAERAVVDSSQVVLTDMDYMAASDALPQHAVISVGAAHLSSGELHGLLINQYAMFAAKTPQFDRLNEIAERIDALVPRKSVMYFLIRFYIAFYAVYLIGLLLSAPHLIGSSITSIAASVASASPSQIAQVILASIVLLAPLIIYVVHRQRRRAKIDRLRKEQRHILEDLLDYYSKMPNKVLSFEYSNPYSIFAIAKVADAYGLHTVKDAVNTYEAERMRRAIATIDQQIWEVEARTREIITGLLVLYALRPNVIVVYE